MQNIATTLKQTLKFILLKILGRMVGMTRIDGSFFKSRNSLRPRRRAHGKNCRGLPEYLKWYCCPVKKDAGTVAEVWIRKGDLTSAHYCLNYGVELLLKLIFALNKEFLPSPKWRLFYSYSLKQLPKNFRKLIRELQRLVGFQGRILRGGCWLCKLQRAHLAFVKRVGDAVYGLAMQAATRAHICLCFKVTFSVTPSSVWVFVSPLARDVAIGIVLEGFGWFLTLIPGCLFGILCGVRLCGGLSSIYVIFRHKLGTSSRFFGL